MAPWPGLTSSKSFSSPSANRRVHMEEITALGQAPCIPRKVGTLYLYRSRSAPRARAQREREREGRCQRKEPTTAAALPRRRYAERAESARPHSPPRRNTSVGPGTG